MTGPELGFVLLCTDLGDGLSPLTLPQLRQLRLRMREAALPEDPDRALMPADLTALGYESDEADRICRLLDRREAVDRYLELAREQGITVMTLRSPDYPELLRSRLGHDAPPVLFCRGERSLLRQKCVGVVGSRELSDAGRVFARRAGVLAVTEHYVLVSGNARGADRTARKAALDAGGCAVSVLADSLASHAPEAGRELCLSEDGWHHRFTACRALRRNRLIHALGEKTLAVQAEYQSGGTWAGSVENLRKGYSPLFVHDDGSLGAEGLILLGATPVRLEQFNSIYRLSSRQLTLL